MDNRFDNLSHAKVRLLYHVVLATKYRRKSLLGIEDPARRAVLASAARSDFDVVEAAIDEGDHMHLLVRVRKPNVSVGQVVRRIKQDTTAALWDDAACAAHLERFYWGRKRKLWSNGYFAATAGNDLEIVRNYIRSQSNWKDIGLETDDPPLEPRN